jgi:hypothetical protein
MLTNRWVDSVELEQAVLALDRIPMIVGDWEGRALTLDPRHVKRAEIGGYVHRMYTNRRDGASVAVLLVCGRPGPVSVHSPEVCYGGAGYALSRSPTTSLVRSAGSPEPAEFWVGKFVKQGSTLPENIHVLCSWKKPNGTWTAPANPRLTFAGSSVLYKIYVVRTATSDSNSAPDDPSVELIERLLPVLDNALTPTGGARS